MTVEEAIAIIRRKTSIPENGEAFEDIEKAYDMAIEALNEQKRCQVTEMCPHCENEVTMNWDVEMYGYQAYCPYCGKRLMLCDECTHSDNDIAGGCDYDSPTDRCSRNLTGKERETNEK